MFGVKHSATIRLRRWRVLLMAGLGVVMTAPARAPRVEPARRAQAATVVTITDRLTFEPRRVTIAVGETVEWNNTSLLVHTVTGDPDKATLPTSAALPDGAAAFDSGLLEPDQTFEHTFTVPGTYRYFCIPHEGASMVGEVVVEAPGSD